MIWYFGLQEVNLKDTSCDRTSLFHDMTLKNEEMNITQQNMPPIQIPGI